MRIATIALVHHDVDVRIGRDEAIEEAALDEFSGSPVGQQVAEVAAVVVDRHERLAVGDEFLPIAALQVTGRHGSGESNRERERLGPTSGSLTRDPNPSRGAAVRRPNRPASGGRSFRTRRRLRR